MLHILERGGAAIVPHVGATAALSISCPTDLSSEWWISLLKRNSGTHASKTQASQREIILSHDYRGSEMGYATCTFATIGGKSEPSKAFC